MLRRTSRITRAAPVHGPASPYSSRTQAGAATLVLTPHPLRTYPFVPSLDGPTATGNATAAHRWVVDFRRPSVLLACVDDDNDAVRAADLRAWYLSLFFVRAGTTADSGDLESLAFMNQTLVQLFQAHVDATPDATAIVDGARTATYRQLAELSNDVAARLLEAGASPGDVVALSSDRSIEWIVGMLAVLRLGGVYLPLPPDLPLERQRLLVREAGARHVLRHPLLQTDLGGAATVITIEVAASSASRAEVAPLIPAQDLHGDRACVLFTSGTTGTPKGVVVRQSSIVRLVVDTNYITLTPA